MRVLHICFADSGGAGIGMLNLHRALLAAGVDSKVLVAKKSSCDERVFCAEQNLNLHSYSQNKVIRLLQKVIRKIGCRFSQLDKYEGMVKQIPSSQSAFFTFPITHYDITQHPLVKEADIIHLHWIANFVDFPSFFHNVSQSIVWTLRDENPGLGGFHYESAKAEFGKYYAPIEDAFIKIKRDSLSGCNNLHLVAMSDVMQTFCSNNAVLAPFPIHRIDNLVDLSSYNSIDRPIAKMALGLTDNAFSVLFVSVTLSDARKNLSIVYEAVKRLPFKTVLICVGKNDFFTAVPEDVICLNSVDSARIMSAVYSAADVFVTPATQESFGKTTVESLSCGTPVISSRAGIAPEVITSENGILLDAITVDAVSKALVEAHDRKYDAATVRRMALERFDSKRIVNEYIALYKSLLS
jgi:glycosyltransferase involved in cell wall biosynthesis